MVKTPRDFKGLLEAGRWFGALTPAFRDALLDAALVKSLPEGHRLFSRGDPCDGLFAAVEGAITTTGVGSSGKEAVLAVVEPPQWFGEIAIFDGLPRTHDAEAAVDSVVLQVPKPALDALLTAHPQWWRELGLLLASKLRAAFLVMEDTALSPLVSRVATRLVFMAQGDWADRSRRVVKVSQELLAGMLSASRQSINQALKLLEAQGLVKVAYKEIEIVDLERLRAASRATAPGQ
jgi:CRP-like cAMP-binding protein